MTLAERQKVTARHEGSHAVADERLSVGRVIHVRILGTTTEPDGSRTGVCRTRPNPAATAEAKAIAALAGPAADPRHDLDASRTASTEVVRQFAGGDVPPGLDDVALRRYWLAAVEFVSEELATIEAVAAALLNSPVEATEEYGIISHELTGDALRAVLEAT